MVPSRIQRTDQRTAALTAGIALIVMSLAAFFSYGYVHGSLVVQGDAGLTFQAVTSSRTLFKAEILGWVVILICDIVVAWAFHIFLKPIHPDLSLLGAWFRLAYTAVLGTALLNLLVVLLLSGRAGYLSVVDTGELHAFMMMHLEAFELIWSIGLIIFGGHLLIVGILAFKSDRIPKIIGIFLWLASIGYMVIHLCKTFLPDNETLAMLLHVIFMIPMVVGELGFGVWLLARGGRARSKTRILLKSYPASPDS
ncbi:DUF4386 domain-containing protein [Paenibacillus sp. UNC499MF]|uniref:DUF4386 domain-containing protein n=1 Tax=Paenibacillus sp. UNC499MF TaxID=1502751 RepID=UPI00089F9E9D|nr:DUF4386 domain-containing protein [Paenibacillus sp. UNC499MF]SEG24833.1 protein of unknown function [Paenibacillus sp. UNC499MF]